MEMFKCKKCNLVMSEKFEVCPKCNAEKEVLITNSRDLDNLIYVLDMNDFESVLMNYDTDCLDHIYENFSDEEIMNMLRRNMYIDYKETIKSFIEGTLLNNYRPIE